MVDATEKSGAMAAFIRSIKKKESGVIRVDRQTMVNEVTKMAKAKGDGRNNVMAKSQGSKGPIKSSKPKK